MGAVWVTIQAIRVRAQGEAGMERARATPVAIRVVARPAGFLRITGEPLSPILVEMEAAL